MKLNSMYHAHHAAEKHFFGTKINSQTTDIMAFRQIHFTLHKQQQLSIVTAYFPERITLVILQLTKNDAVRVHNVFLSVAPQVEEQLFL